MKNLILLLSLCACLGCATNRVWYQPGKDPQETHQDLAGCRMAANQVNNPFAMVNGWWFAANEGNKKELIKNCMESKGYKRVRESDLPKTLHSDASQ